jgi:hypothetical protein
MQKVKAQAGQKKLASAVRSGFGKAKAPQPQTCTVGTAALLLPYRRADAS